MPRPQSSLVVRQTPDRKAVAPDIRAMIDRALVERQQGKRS
jgi:hypothetical protein